MTDENVLYEIKFYPDVYDSSSPYAGTWEGLCVEPYFYSNKINRVEPFIYESEHRAPVICWSVVVCAENKEIALDIGKTYIIKCLEFLSKDISHILALEDFFDLISAFGLLGSVIKQSKDFTKYQMDVLDDILKNE